jgi:NAD(P)-dependent dehydrogenase (short-subunit alcohol dehydrogenase family)
MNLDVGGKRVVVAGGSRGIGRSIALAFAAAGAGVSICARDPQALQATRRDLAAPFPASAGGRVGHEGHSRGKADANADAHAWAHCRLP